MHLDVYVSKWNRENVVVTSGNIPFVCSLIYMEVGMRVVVVLVSPVIQESAVASVNLIDDML